MRIYQTPLWKLTMRQARVILTDRLNSSLEPSPSHKPPVLTVVRRNAWIDSEKNLGPSLSMLAQRCRKAAGDAGRLFIQEGQYSKMQSI